MFAFSEIIRFVVDTKPPGEVVVEKVGNVLKGQWQLAKKYPVQILRGSTLGTAVGALPGAGADIAAWMSYAISKKFSKEPEKFGTGQPEGIVESGAANNSALAGTTTMNISPDCHSESSSSRSGLQGLQGSLTLRSNIASKSFPASQASVFSWPPGVT